MAARDERGLEPRLNLFRSYSADARPNEYRETANIKREARCTCILYHPLKQKSNQKGIIKNFFWSLLRHGGLPMCPSPAHQALLRLASLVRELTTPSSRLSTFETRLRVMDPFMTFRVAWNNARLVHCTRLRDFFTDSTMFCTWGSEFCSSCVAYGMGMSAPVTRNAGASR